MRLNDEQLGQVFRGKKILVTGGAGFVGSYLVERLLAWEAEVIVVDNLVTGSRRNLANCEGKTGFRLVEADASSAVENYLNEEVEMIFHLASPASPVDFEKIPVEIYQVNAMGTHHLCTYATKVQARMLFASTSEVYGDPEIHPQPESYLGNVNTIGPRACYDESKRFGEMVLSVYARKYGLDTRIVRIFNTYGPRMQKNDGRVIPTFINQALKNEAITLHGDGSQTRSFCYVTDLVEYMIRVMASKQARDLPVNIGNPDEHTVRKMAEKIIEMTESKAEIIELERPQDDPMQRKPNIERAIELTGYEPQIGLDQGLGETIDYFKGLTD